MRCSPRALGLNIGVLYCSSVSPEDRAGCPPPPLRSACAWRELRAAVRYVRWRAPYSVISSLRLPDAGRHAGGHRALRRGAVRLIDYGGAACSPLGYSACCWNLSGAPRRKSRIACQFYVHRRSAPPYYPKFKVCVRARRAVPCRRAYVSRPSPGCVTGRCTAR